MHHTMRRKDRVMEDGATWELLKKGLYGVLSTVDDDRQPYGVPLNYVLSDGAIYIHAAEQGHKLTNIASNDKVAFCVVGHTELLADAFSTRYQSAIVFGRASLVGEEEKRAALVALLEKYFPEHMVRGMAYIDKLINSTAVIKVDIEKISGKMRK